MQQVQQLSSQLASIDSASSNGTTQTTLPAAAPQSLAVLPALSESFYLERERERAERQAERQVERQAERERAERAERERAERVEARLIVAFSVSTCTCGIGAAIVGAAVLLKKT